MSLRAAVAATMLLLAGCSRGGEPTPAAAPVAEPPRAEVVLSGAGATFPYPLYARWIDEYQKAHPGVRIQYQSVGSTSGIKQILARSVDFGASDTPLGDDERGGLLQIPTTVGAVVLACNVDAELTLTPELLAAIYLGEVKMWNDPRIVALNPEARLPDAPIRVAFRADGSGTTALFTSYLSSVSPAWNERVGAGKSVTFPVGLGARGNEGVAGQVKTTPGAIGYVELAYAKQLGLPYASLRDGAGKPVALTGLTYVLVYQEMTDGAKARALVDFLWWAVHDGQKLGAALHHEPLPAELVTRNEALLRSITVGGKPVL